MSWGAIKLRYRDSKNVFFDGEASPTAGGGSMPEFQLVTFAVAAVPAHAARAATLTDAPRDGASVLLDLTDPVFPAVLATGVYALGATLGSIEAPVDGGTSLLKLEGDVNGIDVSITGTATMEGDDPGVTCATLVFQMAAGMQYGITVANGCEVQNDFSGVAILQKIS